MLKEENKAADV